MPYFFPVKLRGVGFVDVESLSSYIHRLAHVHGVSIGQLLRYAYDLYAEDNSGFNKAPPIFGLQGDLSVYVRPNFTTQETVRVIEHVTGLKNLGSSTFLSLYEALDRSVGVFSRYMRWCSICMGEFEAQGDSGYFKLIWHLRSVVHCPTHGVKLIDKCPHCDGKQSTFGVRREAIKCQQCGESIAGKITEDDMSNSWEVECIDLLNLVRFISKNSGYVFPKNGVRKVVSKLFDDAWKNKEEEKFWSVIPKEECIGIDTGHKPMTLTIARRVAYRLGVNLLDLLSGEIEMYSATLDSEWLSDLPIDIKPKKRKKQHDREKIHKNIIKVIKSRKDKSPPAFRVVAKEVGVSTGCIQYHFPSLAHAIIEDHKQWQHAEQLRKRREARSQAMQYLTNKDNYGITKSRKSAYKYIREKTGLPKFILKEEINEVYKILNGETHE